MNKSQKISEFLRDVEILLTQTDKKDLGENGLFSENVQKLDGFTVGFMKSDTFQELTSKHGLDASDSEAILMQTTEMTDPHVHLKGESTFLPLGKEQGYSNSKGGTYVGNYMEGESSFSLAHVPAISGETFEVKAGTIHFFAPERGAKFSAIAFVSPRIKQEDGSFDMVHFTRPVVDVLGTRATVALA